MTPSEELDRIFGVGLGETPEERARGSSRRFIRGLDQISEYEGRGTGRVLSALEALEAYGLDVLRNVAREGSALLCAGREAAGQVLRDRRASLGLETRHVANEASIDVAHVEAAEASRRLPLRTYERIARVLGLDERFISVRAEPEGNERLAIRLRTVGRENPRMTPNVVSALAEAAWVAMRQIDLEGRLELRLPGLGFTHNGNYGTSDFAPYRWGYHLAQETRRRLDLDGKPIPSMRDLAERRLGFPIIQSELGNRIAGATVEVGERRAIVVNLEGKNRNAYVRRATVAHEIEHLVYDPPRELNTLRVDVYDELEARAEQLPDPVEQRANAFAVELLAPQAAVLSAYGAGGDDPLGRVMHTFGISFTAARYQVWNALDRSVALESLTTNAAKPEPTWDAAEAFTVDYHPVKRVRPSRAGRFSALVVRALLNGIISTDTAREWLEADDEDLERARVVLPQLYPDVFAP